jgi:hypothetical protein
LLRLAKYLLETLTTGVVEQELLTRPEYLRSPHVFMWVRVAQSAHFLCNVYRSFFAVAFFFNKPNFSVSYICYECRFQIYPSFYHFPLEKQIARQ